MWAKAHSEWVEGNLSPWMDKPWALEKKEKSKVSLVQPYVKRAPTEPREKKRTGPRYLRTAKAREGILEKCKKESARIWTAQGGMPIGIRNEGIHVPSATHNSKEKLWKTDGDLGINTWYREPSTSGKVRR